ncbi:FadR/GntR family transcriptional regulator [Paracoccus sp. KR1-242]|uniref:FadR/GntR family transcriptional regulator n=1 Tax=Paracoccus sp. KR1-242 TaxID=3410028 RepID=UPI003C02290C
MSLKLDKVSRGPHLSTLVASSISREIAQGRLTPGDQLPTEQQLAQTFGVSRNIVREAIARLRSEGLVWSQQGRGAFVATKSDAPALKLDLGPAQDTTAFASLFELRGLLEVEAAALAAGRRGAADLDAMSRALVEMGQAAYGSRAWLAADLAFHQAIASATRNDYIMQCLAAVSERVRDSILASGHHRASDELAEATLGEHQDILSAIGAEDHQAARQAMARHLKNAAGRVGLDAPDNEGGSDGG